MLSKIKTIILKKNHVGVKEEINFIFLRANNENVEKCIKFKIFLRVGINPYI